MYIFFVGRLALKRAACDLDVSNSIICSSSGESTLVEPGGEPMRRVRGDRSKRGLPFRQQSAKRHALWHRLIAKHFT